MEKNEWTWSSESGLVLVVAVIVGGTNESIPCASTSKGEEGLKNDIADWLVLGRPWLDGVVLLHLPLPLLQLRVETAGDGPLSTGDPPAPDSNDSAVMGSSNLVTILERGVYQIP